jgi:hypothetical protein
MLSLHVSEGMRLELEGLEMERDLMKARVTNLEVCRSSSMHEDTCIVV